MGRLALELDQVAEGARVGSLQARFDAMEEREGICVGEPGEGFGERLGGGERVVGVFFGALQVFDVELGLDDGEALQAPLGGDHLVDQMELGGAAGLELIEVGGEELVEFFGVLGGQDEGLGSEAVLERVL